VTEIKLALQGGELFRAYALEFAYGKADIDHTLIKLKHSWPIDGSGSMNQILKFPDTSRMSLVVGTALLTRIQLECRAAVTLVKLK